MRSPGDKTKPRKPHSARRCDARDAGEANASRSSCESTPTDDHPASSYLRRYAGTSLGCLILIVTFNWIVDPLHFYHRPFVHSTFVDNQRYQNPGLAKHYDYDSVVIGTSHTENFLPSSLRQVLGWDTLKLSVSGSTGREQSLILNKALSTGKVENVLWSLDFKSFACGADDFRKSGDSFPRFLYRETPWTPFQYLLSLDTFWFSWRAVCGRGEQDLERLNTWYDEFVFSEERTLAAWKQRHQFSQMGMIPRRTEPAEVDLLQMRENIHRNLVDVVQANPDCSFYLVFPPYSVLTYLDDFTIAEGLFDSRMRFKREVVRSLVNSPNCRIFDFQAERRITHDLNNFKDLSHFSRDVNDFILESIRRDRCRLTPSNWERRLSEFEQSVYDFAYAAFSPQSELYDKLKLSRERSYLPPHRSRAGTHEIAGRNLNAGDSR